MVRGAGHTLGNLPARACPRSNVCSIHFAHRPSTTTTASYGRCLANRRFSRAAYRESAASSGRRAFTQGGSIHIDFSIRSPSHAGALPRHLRTVRRSLRSTTDRAGDLWGSAPTRVPAQARSKPVTVRVRKLYVKHLKAAARDPRLGCWQQVLRGRPTGSANLAEHAVERWPQSTRMPGVRRPSIVPLRRK